MKISYVGEGKVYLIAGGSKIYADIAARFVKSEKSVSEIISSPFSKKILDRLLSSGHKSALEFDYFLFGVEGYSRVCEVQLVRKRHASFMIKSGRTELIGSREFSVVLPERLKGNPVIIDELRALEKYYNDGLAQGIQEEELRYLKPQATEFRGIIGMNAHALYDFFAVRCCMNAQSEIRDLANKMLVLCKEAAPDLFSKAGPHCVQLGYCPENELQNIACEGKVHKKEEALKLLYTIR